jgi:hypothetical protein
MRAVWSFWHEPFADHRAAAWGSETTHLLAWALSVATARTHHRSTQLVTDDAGARLLVDGLGLPFDDVSLSLNSLRGTDPSWWSIGKLVAIGEQTDPFVHIDADVFLWRALPADVVGAPVFAQNPEQFDPGATYYRPEAFETALSGRAGSWLPDEWSWHRRRGVQPRGECCGVVGGTHVEFLRHYAAQAIRLVHEPGNQRWLRSVRNRPPLTITVEQYLLAACIEHHRQRSGSPYRDVDIAYLFDSWAQAADGARAAELGYTHLIADAKRDPVSAERLHVRMQRDHPDLYDRCLAITHDQPCDIAVAV